jgi:hypothetical protein
LDPGSLPLEHVSSLACGLSGRDNPNPLRACSDQAQMSRLKVFKWKSKEGSIDRVTDQYNVIGKGLFKKETDFALFTGMTVQTADGHVGEFS